jgi:5-dehydro-2-deoxygluconokinase
LKKEKVNTNSIPVKNGARTSAAVLGIQPPDNFPLVFYRDNAADSKVDIDDVINANIPDYKILLVSGTALNIEPSKSATFFSTICVSFFSSEFCFF